MTDKAIRDHDPMYLASLHRSARSVLSPHIGCQPRRDAPREGMGLPLDLHGIGEEKPSVSLLLIVVGVEILVVGIALARLRATLRDPRIRRRKSTSPILLFDPKFGDSADRKTPPSRP